MRTFVAKPAQYDNFIANGHTAFRDFQPGKEKELSVGSWAVVTYLPDRLPR